MKQKIFYISFQRVGTKSFRSFMELNNFNVASWQTSAQNNWTQLYHEKKFNKILKSKSFEFFDAFEDGPWFHLDFIKQCFKKIPNSKFIFLERPAEDWFKSMVTHSHGMSLGELERHCKVYDREFDFKFIRKNYPNLTNFRFFIFDNASHYINFYNNKTRELKKYISNVDPNNNSFFIGDLYERNIYRKIAKFLDIKDPIFPKNISHQTNVTFTEVCEDINSAIKYLINLRRLKKSKILSLMKSNSIYDAKKKLQLNNKSSALHYRLAYIYFKLRLINKSLEVANKGLCLNKENPLLNFLLSQIYLKKNMPAESINFLNSALKITPDNPFYLRKKQELLTRDKSKSTNLFFLSILKRLINIFKIN
jgi:hypothetical protein